MRSFLISVALLAATVCIWCGFTVYSEDRLEAYIDTVDDALLSAVEAERWQEASKELLALQTEWTEYRRRADFFLSTEELNKISETFARAERLLRAEDVPGASGELGALRAQLYFLRENEKTNAVNLL